MNSSLILGQPIIIKSISNYSNVVSIPIQKINNDEYIVKVLNINYKDKRLVNTIYANGYYIINIKNELYTKPETSESNIVNKAEIREEPKNENSVKVRTVKINSNFGNIITNSFNPSTETTYVPTILKHETSQNIVGYAEPTVNKKENISESIENIKGSFYENKENEKQINMPKISTYNPKYLQILYEMGDKYALAIKNLDIYSQIEIDNKLNDLGMKRIRYLKKLFKNYILIKHVNVIVPMIDYNYNVKSLIINYETPIFTIKNRIILIRKLEPLLNRPKPLYKAQSEIVVNNLHITEDTIISDEEYEIAEGAKILSWIEHNLVFYGGNNGLLYDNAMLIDLITLQDKGHIYISKGGIKIVNLVNINIIDLKHLVSQYNKPIDHLQLLYYIINGTQNVLNNDEISDEANKILSLEYFICLQPEPKYLLYILKRLVFAWYADIDLILSIIKVRILINQYRARRDKMDNIKLGVLPEILIYLRYGDVNFSKALAKINYYFTNHIYTGWQNNDPDYFTKYNDLIYYSNGSPDIKRFFEHLSYIDKVKIYKPFTINPTSFMKYGQDIVSPYAQHFPYYSKLKYRSVFDLEDQIKKYGRVITRAEQDRKTEVLELRHELINEQLRIKK